MKIIGLIIAYASVFGLSMLELWAAIPLGFVLKINPLLNFALSTAGAITGVAIVIFGGEVVRKFVVRARGGSNKKRGRKKKKNTITIIWEKYGVIGLGLLAPWITGASLGAVIGVALKAEPKKLLFWLSAGTIICAGILVIIGVLGISAAGVNVKA